MPQYLIKSLKLLQLKVMVPKVYFTYNFNTELLQKVPSYSDVYDIDISFQSLLRSSGRNRNCEYERDG